MRCQQASTQHSPSGRSSKNSHCRTAVSCCCWANRLAKKIGFQGISKCLFGWCLLHQAFLFDSVSDCFCISDVHHVSSRACLICEPTIAQGILRVHSGFTCWAEIFSHLICVGMHDMKVVVTSLFAKCLWRYCDACRFCMNSTPSFHTSCSDHGLKRSLYTQ